MRQFSIGEHAIAQAVPLRAKRDRAALPRFEVWQENWRTLQFFIRLRRQWSVVAGAMSVRYQGIRAEAIESVLRTARVPVRDREMVMDDLLEMSDAAAKIFNGEPANG